MLARQAALPASTRWIRGGNYKSTKASVRYDCNKGGWVPCGDEDPLSQWFSAGVVLSLTSSAGSTLSGWAKISVG